MQTTSNYDLNIIEQSDNILESVDALGENATLIDTALTGKQDTLTAGTGITISNNVISATGGGGGGTTDYTDLTNKPQINSVTLSGNKSFSDLGIPEITYSTTDLTAGTSILATGTFYFVYE